VNLKVFNALGQEIKSLVSGNLAMGTYSTQFTGKNLNSGVYFYKLEFTDINGKYFSDIKKLLLVK
jgi:hypothetical protein